MRADLEAVRVVRPDGIWSTESQDARRARVNAALGSESVDASGLSGNHVMRFLMAGWCEEYDHTGRRIALHPPGSSSSAAMDPIRLPPAPTPAPERPSRGPCFAPGCGREVRRLGDKFCGSPECREWARSAQCARARERMRTLYAQNPALYIQRVVESRRRTRQRDRLTSRTHLHRCFGGDGHWFEIVDRRFATCGDPAHRKAHQRERNRLRQARYYTRHLRAPSRSRHRPKRYVPRARFIVTEALTAAE